jgi:hypothetical protein
MKWFVEVEVLEDRVITKVTNPDGSWGVIENLVTEAGIVELGVTSHSDNLDVNAFKAGMQMGGYGFVGTMQ